jgi:predicted RNase H-like nuclease (RuvC/YqgF family)
MVDFPHWVVDLDYYKIFTGIASALILSIVILIGRYIWKIWKGQGKTAERIKTLQERVDGDEVSLRALGATNDEYRRTIDSLLRSNREMHRRVEALEHKVAESEVVRRENTVLKARVAELEQRVAELEAINQVEPVRKRGPDELKVDQEYL